MTKEEFAEIIKPLSLLDNPKHREFIRQVLTGNFNRWQEGKAKKLNKSDVMLSLPSHEEIETEIYQHLNSLPYAGGYPNDWIDTLASHIGKWLKERE